MFFSDMEVTENSARFPTKIERASMDGSQRRTLVSGQKLINPHGLALDYVNKRIYWTDPHLNQIAVVGYNGDNR